MRQTRFFLGAILAGVIGTIGCRGDQGIPFEPQAPAYSLGDLVSAVLLQCTPLPYSSHTAVIGPQGGTLAVGPHSLVVPAGALQQAVSITGEVVPGNVNSVRFQPEGLQFEENSALTMSYSNCSGLGMLLPKKIVYTNELLGILDVLNSVNLAGQKKVTAPLQHFSRYAIAY